MVKFQERSSLHYDLAIVLPRKVYAIQDTTMTLYHKNVIKGLSPLVHVRATASRGKPFGTQYNYSPTAAEAFDLTLAVRDMNLTEVTSQTVTVEAVDAAANTARVNLLAIGDSITRSGEYVRTVQNTLPNVQTVGTRTYDDGVLCVEGRGGWSLNGYFTHFGNTASVDSPFLFPVGVAGSKYKGNTEVWKKICFTEPDAYDYQGFQKMARGWAASDAAFQYDANGYPVDPAAGDVVVDPTKPAGATILQYDGASWVAMNPQPAVELHFAKYMERYAAAFGENLPNAVSVLLATNDFQESLTATDLDTFIARLRALIASIRAYDPGIKIILNLPLMGAAQDNWAKAGKTAQDEIGFDRNMHDVGLRLLAEFDTDAELANRIYVCALGMGLDKANMNDHVHPTLAGHAEAGYQLASLIQKIR